MRYSYQDSQTEGVLKLIVYEPGFDRQFFLERNSRLLTIVWNQGPDQKVTIDGIDYVFPEQTMLPLVVNQSFTFGHPETIIAWQFNREFYCIVDHDREVSCVGLLFYGANLPLFLHLDDREKRKFEALLMVFDDEFSTQDSIQGEMLRMLLKRLIIKLTRLTRDQFINTVLTEPDLTIIRRFNLLVETHFRKFHTVSDYADLLNKSPKTLSNLFALYNQQSPLQAIHERIALEARRLLLYTDKSTKEIGFELGFDEIPHFSRFFKKQTGLPPSKFKVAGLGAGGVRLDAPSRVSVVLHHPHDPSPCPAPGRIDNRTGSTAISERVLLLHLCIVNKTNQNNLPMATFTVPTRDQVSAQNQAIFDNLQKGLGFVPNLYATFGLSENGLGA